MAPPFTAPDTRLRLIGALSRHFRLIILTAAIIFVAAVVGSLSRPTGFLAAFWPANVVLAALLLRQGWLGRVMILPAAVIGFLAAAAVVGDHLAPAALMTLANITSAVTVAVLLAMGTVEDRALSRPQGVFSLVLASVAGSAAGAILGGIAQANTIAGSYFDGWSSWFAAELVNYLALLPVALTWSGRPFRFKIARSQLAAVAALAVTVGFSLAVPHPIAVVFPVPALIWCALTLPMVATTTMVMLYSGLAMLGLKLDLFAFGLDGGLSGMSIAAVHLGIAFIALGPVVAASASVERRRQVEQLTRLARDDALTGALTRGAFNDAGHRLVRTMAEEQASVAVLLVDADHFKQINDSHGHVAGDRVLTAIAAAIKTSIRQGDVFGRIGGEEFALVLPRISRAETIAVAERIRRAVDNLAVVLDSNHVQRVTVSIGVAFAASGGPSVIEMISLADRAMYDAKRAGRNRVEVCDVTPAETQGQ